MSIYLSSKVKINYTFLFLFGVMFICCQQCLFGQDDKSEKDTKPEGGIFRAMVTNDTLPPPIMARLYVENNIASFRGRLVFQDIIEGKEDGVKTVIKLASISEEQRKKMSSRITQSFNRSEIVRISTNAMETYWEHLHEIQNGKNPEPLSEKEMEILGNHLVNFYRAMYDIGSEALLAVLSPEQIQVLREYFLAKPPLLQFSLKRGDKTFIQKEIEVSNFDSFKALNLSKQQQQELDDIYKKFEPQVSIYFKDIVEVQYGFIDVDQKKLSETVNKLEDLILKTQKNIEDILTEQQKTKLKQLRNKNEK
jgi:hypothetical protein